MKIYLKERPKKTVYVQIRQAIRDKKGRMAVTETKTITLHDITIEQVQAILEKGESRAGS